MAAASHSSYEEMTPEDKISFTNNTIGDYDIPQPFKISEINTMHSPRTLSKFGLDVETRSYRRNFSKYENQNVS